MKHHIYILTLFILFYFSSTSLAVTLAVFPIEDMSEGLNGIDYELTEQLNNDMAEKGLDVIGVKDIISFMGRNRIRRLGVLDTISIFKTRDELGADFILYGSFYSNTKESIPVMGLNLYLVRTVDARIIWSNSEGISRSDVQHLLGLGEPDTKAELSYILRQNVLRTWPDELEFVEGRQLSFEIDDVQLTPVYLRPGEEIKCKVKLNEYWLSEESPRVFFKVNGRVFRANETTDGTYYEAEWTGFGRDGNYPVTLVVNWPSGKKKVAYVGTYFIDSQPPKVTLNLKGIRLQGTVAFRDQVLIIPHMMDREPISRWNISVVSEKGEELMSESGKGNLPQRFVWRGQQKSGKLTNEGIYQVILKSWDRAQNMGVTSQYVMFSRKPPEMVLEAKMETESKNMMVNLDNEGSIPIAFWRMEMRNTEGIVLKYVDGDDLPVQVELDNSADDSKITCIVVMKDVLGNQIRKEIDDILLYSMKSDALPQGSEFQDTKESAWVEGF